MSWSARNSIRLSARFGDRTCSVISALVQSIERHLSTHEAEHGRRDHSHPDCVSCRLLRESIDKAKEFKAGIPW